MRRIIIVILMGLAMTMSAQKPKKISIIGRVVHQNTEQALEYATVAFINAKGKTIGGNITDKKGRFQVKIPAGTYDVSVEYIGFKPRLIKSQSFIKSVDMGFVSLEENAMVLDEAEVIAEKTTVELHLDKKVYNVGRDLSLSGGNASDVLDNVPSVSVDVEGNIALRGNENVRVLINGKPSGLAGISSTDGLRQLPAEAVQKVEVITSPSARYDAEGTAGILNIVLKRSKMQGFNGVLSSYVRYPWGAGASANLNYRINAFNFFTTTGYRYGKSEGYGKTFTQYFNKQNAVNLPDTYLDEYTKLSRKRGGLSSNVGVEWYVNPTTSITVSALLKDADSEREHDNHIERLNAVQAVQTTVDRQELKDEKDKAYEYAFNLSKNFNTKGHKLTIDAQYEDDAENETGSVFIDQSEDEQLCTYETQKRYFVQADYVLPFSEKGQFELGYKANYKDKLTDYSLSLWESATNSFDIDENVSNILKYNEHVNAAYTQFGNRLGDKLTYLVGLRFEHTETEIIQKTSTDYRKKTYADFFPTANLSYAVTEQHSFTLGYARRIRRPHSRMLNPFPSRSSLSSIFQGNPDINPSYSGTFDITYLYRLDKMTLSSSVYYQHTTDMFNFVSFDTGETVEVNGEEVPIIRRGPINLSTNNRIGAEATFNYFPSRKWRISGNINLFHSVIDGDFNGVSYDAKHFSWFARLSNKYRLPASIDWQTKIRYMGPRNDAQNSRKAMFMADIGFSKDILKNRASVAFNVSDLFNSRKRSLETTTATYYSEAEFMWRERTYTLSFTYRFNQKKKRNTRQQMEVEEEGDFF